MNFPGILELRWQRSVMRQHWLLLKRVLRLRFNFVTGYFQHLNVDFATKQDVKC